MKAYDQLLLSEGVCRQLGIINYHPCVHPFKQKQKVDNNEGKEIRTSNISACRDGQC